MNKTLYLSPPRWEQDGIDGKNIFSDYKRGPTGRKVVCHCDDPEHSRLIVAAVNFCLQFEDPMKAAEALPDLYRIAEFGGYGILERLKKKHETMFTVDDWPDDENLQKILNKTARVMYPHKNKGEK
jgi:hypothetical protein